MKTTRQEMAKKCLDEVIRNLTSDIIRLESTVIHQEQELDAMHRRLEALKAERGAM